MLDLTNLLNGIKDPNIKNIIRKEIEPDLDLLL